MKYISIILISCLLLSKSLITVAQTNDSQRTKWFSDAKFGLFIHWGLYSVPAGYWKGKPIPGPGEWIMYEGKIPVKEYEQLTKKFNPTQFSADKWTDLAKEAGMKYIVFTAKHCDGFAMYNSKVSDYNIVAATPYKSDVLKKLEQACFKRSIKLGFYYSHNWDWHEKNALGLENNWDFPEHDKKDQNAYFNAKSLPQVKELVSLYKPDLLWFDVPTTIDLSQSKAFLDTIRKYRPDCIINDRIGNGLGDYQTPEQYIPTKGSNSLFESCMTLNDTWGYKVYDHNWKSASTVIYNLVDVVSKGGNYLLNVGPDEKGNFPEASIKILKEVGKWMKMNGESIYGTTSSPLGNLQFGFCTAKPGKLYFHVFNWPENGILTLPGITTRIQKIYLMNDSFKKPLKFNKIGDKDIEVKLNSFDISAQLLNDINNVIVLEYNGQVQLDDKQLLLSEGYSTTFAPNAAEVKADSLKYIFNDKWDETRGYITANWTKSEDKLIWNYRLLSDGWFDIEIEYGAADEVKGSAFEIVSGDQKVTANIESTGGYYFFKTKSIGRIHLKASSENKLEMKPIEIKGGSLMNLKKIKLIPVSNQALNY